MRAGRVIIGDTEDTLAIFRGDVHRDIAEVRELVEHRAKAAKIRAKVTTLRDRVGLQHIGLWDLYATLDEIAAELSAIAE